MLQITVDMFSGRENPTLILEGAEAQRLLEEISTNKSILASSADETVGLGYRGLIVEALDDRVAVQSSLPGTLRIAGRSGKELEIAERMVSSMLKADAFDRTLHDLMIQELKRSDASADATVVDQAVPPTPSQEVITGKPQASATCMIELGAFNPGFWNDPAHIGRNNCYNYASNRRTDTFAQPGRATGHQATVMACPNVTAGAISDGLHHRFNCFPDSEKPRWLMALVVAPGYDYHWYRKQKEGFWGHKPGGTAARNVDNNGAVVLNPETAARGPYTLFCGYFYACKSQKIR